MNTLLFFQMVLNALMLAGLYVMAATGLSLVLGVLHIINFAHGAFLMFGAYAVWMLVDKEKTAIEAIPDWIVGLDLPYPIAAVVAVIAIGALGALVNKVLYQRFWGKVLLCLIVAVGLTQIMQQGALITFGIHTRSVPTYFEGIVNIFGARFPLERLVIIAVAVVLVTGLLLLLRHTKVGLAMRAVAQDSDAAAVSGVNIPRTATVAMFLGCAMAAAAAVVIAPVFTVHAYMADGFLIRSPHVIAKRGIVRTFQLNLLFRSLSVRENVRFAYRLHRKTGVVSALLLSEHAGPSVANAFVKLLGAVYRAACADHDELRDPVAEWRMGGGKVHRAKRRTIAPPAEVLPRWRRGLEAGVPAVMRDMVWMGLFTGLRVSEVSGPGWEDIDGSLGWLWIRETKSGRPLELPVTGRHARTASSTSSMCSSFCSVMGLNLSGTSGRPGSSTSRPRPRARPRSRTAGSPGTSTSY